MRKSLSSVLAFALLAVAAAPLTAVAQPTVVKDQTTGNAVTPPAAPPAPKDEPRPMPRRGMTWISGEWEWHSESGGNWKWRAGRFERRQPGKMWSDGRWEERGGRWERIRGEWRDAPKEPMAPPAPIAETPQQRRGHVWVAGYWQWNDGNYDWVPGKLERRQRGRQWAQGQWTNAGGRWTWNAGQWQEAPKVQPAPPEPIAEIPKFRRGFAWVPGHWDWDDGSYEWTPGKLERRQRGKRLRPGGWAQVGGQWQWNGHAWDPAPQQQDAPPPPIIEAVTPRRGYVWAKGRYEWRNGDYEWTPGHWERERKNKRWVDGGWQNVSGSWTFSIGGWQ